jgi:putative copper export protein
MPDPCHEPSTDRPPSPDLRRALRRCRGHGGLHSRTGAQADRRCGIPKVEFHLFRRIRRTYPLAVIPLYVTGFYMYFGHIDNYGGFSELIATSFGQLLTLKMTIALGLLTIFASSPFLFMQPEKRSPSAT